LSGFLIRLKEPATALAIVLGIVVTFGSGFFAGAHWYVSSELDPLRKEVAGLAKNIEDNRSKLSSNGERLAGIAATLAGIVERVDRLHTQVTKNTETITDVRVRGTPGP